MCPGPLTYDEGSNIEKLQPHQLLKIFPTPPMFLKAKNPLETREKVAVSP